MELEALDDTVALAYQICIRFYLFVFARRERHICEETFEYEPTSS